MSKGRSAALGRARRHRAALASSAGHWRGHEHVEFTPQGKRYTLEAAELVTGEGAGAFVVFRDPRPVRWPFDLQRQARRMAVCERGSVLLWDEERSCFSPSPMRCKCRACPVCARVRAGSQAARWRPRVERAIADKAYVRHFTLTQACENVPGGLVTDEEHRRYKWNGTIASEQWGAAYPVAGESLAAAYARLRANLRAWRQNRKSRDLVAGHLGGYLLGVEWTGRGRNGIPRWHAHAHILSISLESDDGRAALEAWCDLTGASPQAQHVRDVGAEGIAEVLKYPFKPANLTSAQRIAVLASMRGLRPQTPGGRWYGRARREPWSTWYGETGPRQARHRRVLWYDEELSEWMPYGTGSMPRGSTARFGVLGDVKGELETWESPTDIYASALGSSVSVPLPSVTESMSASWLGLEAEGCSSLQDEMPL